MSDGFDIRQVAGDYSKAAARMKAEALDAKRRSEIRKAITTATKPVRQKIRDAAMDRLPHKGGLNRWAAVLPTAISTFSANSSSVKIRQTKRGHDLKSLDEGTVRHPVYGDRKAWVEQSITPGYFTDTVEAEAPKIRDEVTGAISKYIETIGKELQ